jgi:hypothetical protein
VVKERRQKIVLFLQQIESGHEIHPCDGVDHLKREQHPFGLYLVYLIPVPLDGGTEAHIQAESPINEISSLADEPPERAFQEAADVSSFKPIRGLCHFCPQQILSKLARMG